MTPRQDQSGDPRHEFAQLEWVLWIHLVKLNLCTPVDAILPPRQLPDDECPFFDVLILYKQTRVASAVMFSTQAASFLSLTVCHTHAAPNTHSNETQRQKYILGAPYTFGCLNITLYWTIPADYDRRTKNFQAFRAHPSFRLLRDKEGDWRQLWRWEFFAVTSSLGLAAHVSCHHVQMTGCGRS